MASFFARRADSGIDVSNLVVPLSRRQDDDAAPATTDAPAPATTGTETGTGTTTPATTAAAGTDTAVASAAPKNILVEKSEFTPAESEGILGDIIFHIRADNASVATTSLDKPCRPNSAGVMFWSGELMKGDTFTVSNIKAEDTILIYNPKAKSCAEGFVGIINPTENITLSAFEEAASAYAADSVAPAGTLFGGIVGGTATPEDTEPFYLKHLTAIVGVIIALVLIIALGAGFFCFKAKRKMARQRREQQQQQEEQGGYDDGQDVPGSYPQGDDYDDDDDINGKRYQ